jgi:hypothetical protein
MNKGDVAIDLENIQLQVLHGWIFTVM